MALSHFQHFDYWDNTRFYLSGSLTESGDYDPEQIRKTDSSVYIWKPLKRFASGRT
ncbi:MAG: hypothetical protein Q7J65_00265 [Candidatus Marinimicrobia bacterium]|nr:hypothetical protein [Candidatus Neomarinimicrobiota bacterium]